MNEPMKNGRPTVYTQALAELICEQLAEGATLRSICRQDGFPDEKTVRNWVLENRNGFADPYMRARTLGFDSVADEVLAISDDPSGDVQRDKLRIDSRKWYLSKLSPRKFGDRVELGADDSAGGIRVIVRSVLDTPE